MITRARRGAVVAVLLLLVSLLVATHARAELFHPRQQWLRDSTAGLFLHWGMGTQVVIEFDQPSTIPRRLPDVRYWEPAVTVHATGTGAEVSWPAPSASPHGDRVHYALWTVGGDGQPAAAPTRHRICVDLGEPRPLGLVVFRTRS